MDKEAGTDKNVAPNYSVDQVSPRDSHVPKAKLPAGLTSPNPATENSDTFKLPEDNEAAEAGEAFAEERSQDDAPAQAVEAVDVI